MFGLFGKREKTPRRLKLHDIEVRFAVPGGGGTAKLDQNIYSDERGTFQLIVRGWKIQSHDAPLELWVGGRMVARWPMSGGDFKLRADRLELGAIPTIMPGSTVELRRAGDIVSGVAEAD